LAEYEAKLAGAESEAQTVIAKAQQTAETAASRIRQEAETDADEQKQRARADIDSARGVALDELSNQSVNLAVQLASQIVGRELKQDDHTALIQDALKQFSSSS
jgi:F-type H+-transporting ATPase subunit b